MPTNISTFHSVCESWAQVYFSSFQVVLVYVSGCVVGYVCVYYHVYELVSLIRGFLCKYHNAGEVLVGYELLL